MHYSWPIVTTVYVYWCVAVWNAMISVVPRLLGCLQQVYVTGVNIIFLDYIFDVSK